MDPNYSRDLPIEGRHASLLILSYLLSYHWNFESLGNMGMSATMSGVKMMEPYFVPYSVAGASQSNPSTVPTEKVTYRELIVFKLISQKLPIPIPIGNCFGINKVIVTDTDPQKSPIPIPIGTCFGIKKLPLPIPIPIRSHLPLSVGLFGLIMTLPEFPRDFVHSASKYRTFSGILCALHQNATLVAEKAHEQTPQKPNGGKVVSTENKGTVATKVLHEQKIDPSQVYNIHPTRKLDRFP